MKLWILIIAALVTSRYPANGDIRSAQQCGAPLLQARQGALDLPLANSYSAQSLSEGMKLLSRSAVAEIRFFLGPISGDEESLMATVKKMPSPLIHRLPLDRLRPVLASGRLLAPREEERLSRAEGSQNKNLSSVFTPPLEDSLYGAHHCVFATLGPAHGHTRYGEVILRINRNMGVNTWGTPSSGWAFIKNKRHRVAQVQAKAGFEDRLQYSMTVIAASDFDEYMGLALVAFLRKKPAEEREKATALLLATRDASTFWSFVDTHRLGYLEVKMEGAIPLSQIDSIEVPAKTITEIFNWPEAAKWKNKIRAYD